MTDKKIPQIEEIDDFEKDVYDPSNIDYSELKLNPDFYIHFSLIKAISALANPQIKEGFLQYTILIENIESIAYSCNRIPENYEKLIKDFEKGLNEKDQLTKLMKISKKKLELILKEIFKHKTYSAPIKL